MTFRRRTFRHAAWIVALAATFLMVAGGFGSAASAAYPATQVVRQKAQPLENGPTVPPGPFLTIPPSAHVVNDPHWAPNVRANTDNTPYAQQEPSVSVNPLNPLNVVAAQKDERSAPAPNTATKEVWIDTSTDGGQTWPVQTHIPMPDSSLPQQSDPVVTFGENNIVYVTIIGLSDAGGLGTNTTMVARSTDGGLTWPTPAVRLNPGQGGSDKEWTAVDTSPTSPYRGRVYTTWTNFAAGPAFIEKWSSDNGVTWNPPGGSNYVTVSWGSYDGGQFSMPLVLPDGTVLATWNDFGGDLVVAKSTDGGQSFINPNHAAVNIVDVNDVPNSQWRLNTIPSTIASPATGAVVSVWADGRNGKDDIYFTRSTDSGTTWSAPARIAHNTAGSSYQVEPWVSAAPNGRFDVIWYDDRDFIGTNPNIFHIYANHSTDDGATWTADEQVTDASTNLNIGIPTGSGWNNAAGDYINVTSFDGGAYAVWTDTRSGTNEDIYSSRYTPGGVGTVTPSPTTQPTATSTATTQPTSTATTQPTSTATTQPTSTEVPPTSTSAPSNTAEATATSTTAPPTSTSAPPTSTVQPTATSCTISYPDVPVGSTFYTYIRCLSCRGIISGFPDGTFKPNSPITRAQIAKMVAIAAGFNETVVTQTYEDIPTDNPYFQYIGRLTNRGIIGGYPCGQADNEPCIPPGNRPYFRPNTGATRGQLSKIVAKAANLETPPTTQTFEDVGPDNPFYIWIENLAIRNVMQGYACGGPTEPCVPPSNRPYFRWNVGITRGQASKIVANTFFPGCSTPARK